MAVDAFDPGPDGSYPYFPRNAAGEPVWSETADSDKRPVDGVAAPMPRGLRREAGHLVDLTPRKPDGAPIDPPTIPPAA